jgi:hypothetical protein
VRDQDHLDQSKHGFVKTIVTVNPQPADTNPMRESILPDSGLPFCSEQHQECELLSI